MARDVSWIRAARKDFEKFPSAVQERFADALVIVSEGEMPGNAKPLANLGAGVFEVTQGHQNPEARY